MGVNDEVQDNLIEADLDALRLESGIRADVTALLTQMYTEIRAELDTADPAAPTRVLDRQRRLERVMTEFIEPTIAQGFTTIAATVEQRMTDVAQITVQGTQRAVRQAVGVNLLSIGVPQDVLQTLVRNTLLPIGEQSATARDWWQRTAEKTQQRTFDTINKGIIQGDDTRTIIKALRGTPAQRFTDGTEALTQKAADALVRTYTNGVLNEARLATYDRNDDVIKAMRHLSTLDSRTSVICVARSGGVYTVPEHRPIPPTTLPYLSGPPYHFRCRSTMVPVLKSFRELMGSDLGERMDAQLAALPEATRSSIDGQIPESTTFDAFLRRKGEAFQVQLLGRTRRDLWDEGKLSLPDLLSAATGNPLSIEELQKRYA